MANSRVYPSVWQANIKDHLYYIDERIKAYSNGIEEGKKNVFRAPPVAVQVRDATGKKHFCSIKEAEVTVECYVRAKNTLMAIGANTEITAEEHKHLCGLARFVTDPSISTYAKIKENTNAFKPSS